MAKGNKIIASANPKGHFTEGKINGALVPGTVVQIDTSEGIDSGTGRFDWEAFNQDADGDQRLIAVLLEDSLQGKLQTDAYVTGDTCFVYFPIAGEELNMLIANLAGTADDHSFGEILMVNDGDGLLVATTGSPESEPFTLLETITDPTADTLAHCIFTGY